jgi:hypothetical protein
MSKFHINLTSTPQLKAEIGKDPAGLSIPGLIRLIDLMSGGPGALGAVPQRISETEMQWSSIAAEFLADEDGNLLVDEDGNYLVG